jgi:hypothetical protein
VAVIIDKAGRDYEAVGLNGPGRRVPEFAQRHNFAVADRDIAAEGRHARAIDYTTMFDDQIIGHYQSSLHRPPPQVL